MQAEVLAYVHWTRPHHAGGVQHFYSAIGLASFVSAGTSRFLVGGIGKSSRKSPWEPWVIECGERNANAMPENHLVSFVRPGPSDVEKFGKAWGFMKFLPEESVVAQYTAFGAQFAH